jgi:hypothetical protein
LAPVDATITTIFRIENSARAGAAAVATPTICRAAAEVKPTRQSDESVSCRHSSFMVIVP